MTELTAVHACHTSRIRPAWRSRHEMTRLAECNEARSVVDVYPGAGLRAVRAALHRGMQVAGRQRHVVPVVESTFTTCMEQLQEGYVSAVAATAGCTLELIKRDIYGTDVRIIREGSAPHTEEVALMAQLKNSTSVRPDPTKEFFSYQFKKRVYFDKLAMRRTTSKAILLVMATEPVQSDWSKSSHEALEVRNCCYWLNLEGATAAPGVQAPTVRVPTRNIFDAISLTEMLDRIERGEEI